MRVMVTGAAGQLGSELVAYASSISPGKRGSSLEVVACDRKALDVTERDEVMEAVLGSAPDVIFHAAAATDVDGCEEDHRGAFLVNALGTRNVAEAARRCGAHLCYLSTDYVFDGKSERPYTEWDTPNPLSVYGASKLAGEREAGEGATVVRTSWLSGTTGRNMVKTVLQMASRPGSRLKFVDDQRGSPTFVGDAVPAIWKLATERMPGTYHVANDGEATWFELARAVLEAAGLDPFRVEPIATAELDPPRPAKRPAYSVLDCTVARAMGVPPLPHWRDGLGRLVAQLRGAGPR